MLGDTSSPNLPHAARSSTDVSFSPHNENFIDSRDCGAPFTAGDNTKRVLRPECFRRAAIAGVVRCVADSLQLNEKVYKTRARIVIGSEAARDHEAARKMKKLRPIPCNP